MLPTAGHKMTHSTPVKNYLVCSPKIPSTAVRFCRHVMQNSMSFIKSFFLSKQSSETPQISVQTQNSQIGRFNVYIIASNLNYMEKSSDKYNAHLPQQYHNPKCLTFSEEIFKGFEFPLNLLRATTTQLLSSGKFGKLRYDTVLLKCASANIFFLYKWLKNCLIF